VNIHTGGYLLAAIPMQHSCLSSSHRVHGYCPNAGSKPNWAVIVNTVGLLNIGPGSLSFSKSTRTAWPVGVNLDSNVSNIRLARFVMRAAGSDRRSAPSIPSISKISRLGYMCRNHVTNHRMGLRSRLRTRRTSPANRQLLLGILRPAHSGEHC
jgi:hypothetical protein